ncbi:MAG: hypothetical protein POH28_00190 [Acidocella sp.]|nr:hypothetical protein [Acidocella sp.]
MKIPPITPEDTALAAIAAFDGPIFVDFDETLYVRNSTEDFIDLATPGIIAVIILKALDIIAPWRLTGGHVTRDNFRVGTILCLFPWTIIIWRAACRHYAAQRTNIALWRALHGKNITIASNGFTPLIRPMLVAMGGADIPLIACALFAPGQRRAGKAALIGAERLAPAMLITDSTDDAPALAVCAHPLLVKWRAARFYRALSRIYFPGDYLSRVKRPGQPGVLRQLCIEDLGFWLLLAATSTPIGLTTLAAICFLFASFWSVYEAGYAENDRCAARFEAEPVLTPQARDFGEPYFEVKAWTPAILYGVLGLDLLPAHRSLAQITSWAAALAALRLVYFIYNRLDKSSRVWLYPVLQWFRSFALLVLLPATPIALLAGGAQIAARSFGYFAYRLAPPAGAAHATWPALPLRLLQLAFLLLALATRLITAGIHGVPPIPTMSFLTWTLFLARRELLNAARHAHLINRQR